MTNHSRAKSSHAGTENGAKPERAIYGCGGDPIDDDLTDELEQLKASMNDHYTHDKQTKLRQAIQDMPTPYHYEPGAQFKPEGWWGNGDVLYKCMKCEKYFRIHESLDPRKGHACSFKITFAGGGYATEGDATSEYVNQDR